MELKRRKSKKRRNNKGIVYKVWKKKCNCEKGVKTRKERDFISRIQNRKKKSSRTRERQYASQRKKYSKAVYEQRFQKRQQEREVSRGT